jgi:hypothetical protein
MLVHQLVLITLLGTAVAQDGVGKNCVNNFYQPDTDGMNPSMTLTAVIDPLNDELSEISGSVSIEINDIGDCDFAMYELLNAPGDCVECSIAIHEGTSCGSDDMIGIEYWNQLEIVGDPWEAQGKYSFDSSSSGYFTFNNGYGYEENLGHVVVVQSADGSKIGCGVLERHQALPNCLNNDYYNGDVDDQKINDSSSRSLMADIHPFFGSTSKISGSVSLQMHDPLTKCSIATYVLSGAPVDCNSCGFHIHEGRGCGDVGGHLFNKEASGDYDPWNFEGKYSYESSLSGAFTFNHGYTYEETLGHVIVIHDSKGSMIGCGELRALDTGLPGDVPPPEDSAASGSLVPFGIILGSLSTVVMCICQYLEY